jgi:hypothetical protein
MDKTLSQFRFLKLALRGPQNSLGGFFGPQLFRILKSSHQDLSHGGLIFILTPLERSHQTTQT